MKAAGGVSISWTAPAPLTPILLISMVYVTVAPLWTGSGEAAFVTVRSGSNGVAVGVGVLAAVGLGVIVAVGTMPGVGVIVGVLVAVGVVVGVTVGVLVGVGGGVGTPVVIWMVLFPSLDSRTKLFGSTVAVFVSSPPDGLVRKPVTMMVAIPLGPVLSAPRSQSRMPPVTAFRSEQMPRVVLKPVYVNLLEG